MFFLTPFIYQKVLIFSIFEPRCVFDALRMHPETNMGWFGVLALDRFRDKLPKYEMFCHQVTQIPHFKESKNLGLTKYVYCNLYGPTSVFLKTDSQTQ